VAHRLHVSIGLTVWFLALGACDGAPVTSDAGVDAGSAADAGALDGGEVDAAIVVDAGPADAGSLDAGPTEVGVIEGTCGVLDDGELLSPSSFVFDNAIDFPMAFTPTDETRLSAGAQEILLDGTAGGSSGYSEAFSFEVLHRCEGAALLKSETEIVYDATGSITDILVEIGGHRVGVSVTRAVAFPFDTPYDVPTAQMLLERKLAGILESTANVSAGDAWVKQILYVIAYAPMHAASILAAWDLVDPSLRADTILMVTVTNGMDDFIY
jgi:hypothetical protein